MPGIENTAPERTLKAALIQRVLDDDAEIRRHTEPWMEKVRQLLGGTAKRRRVTVFFRDMDQIRKKSDMPVCMPAMTIK